MTCDVGHDWDYQLFYDAIDVIGGVRMADSLWGISSVQSVSEVRDWLRALLGAKDTVVVLRLQLRPVRATHSAPKEATNRLHAYGR